ncbi:VENN motif pre-toxin domain-containing protein, partial [Xanthomonas sp. 3058]|uniref:VENN motif pre-toxin domain-containing protein n=1 Tax=Xanthomonas sp. 3058 TaxID=3035314 RepID=UPI00161E01F6
FAGNGGYHVTAGNVNLIGGAIASTNAGASELTADSLTFIDLKNQMDYSAVSAAISGGIGSTGDGETDANGKPVQQSVGNQFRDIGHNIVNGNYGEANYSSFNPGIPVMQSGSDTSYTRATLTEGNIKIGGKTTTAAALGINTDASAAHEAVAALPDVRKILGEQQALAAATGTVMTTAKQIGDDIAASANRKVNEAEAQYKGSLSPEEADRFAGLSTADKQREMLQNSPDYSAAYTSQQQWGIGGDYSRALQAVTTVVVGGLSGQGGGQVATNALAPYAAQLIGRTFDQNHGSDPNAALQVLSHAVLGAVLAQVNGTSMTGGALAGAGGELAAKYLTQTLYGDDPRAIDPVTGKFNPNLLPEQDKQILVALSEAVGAIAGGLAGGSLADAATSANIAKNAVENNWLTKSEDDYLKLAKSLCQHGSKDACDAEKKLTALDKIRDEEKKLYSDKVTNELKAAGKLTQENYDKAMESYWKDQGFFIRERDVVYSGDVSSRTFPTSGELMYNGIGEMADNLKYAQPGTALSLFLGRGLLAGFGQTVAGWEDAWSSNTAINYFTGESVIGLDALDARVLSLADILTLGMTGTSKARPVIAELENQIEKRSPIFKDLLTKTLPDEIRGDGLNKKTAQDVLNEIQAGGLPGRPISGLGTPREMPATSDPDLAAETLAKEFFGGVKPSDATNMKNGSWRAKTPDGTWVTYRPAGIASDKTLQTTASLDINGKSVNLANGGEHNVLKLKFPLTGNTGPNPTR